MTLHAEGKCDLTCLVLNVSEPQHWRQIGWRASSRCRNICASYNEVSNVASSCSNLWLSDRNTGFIVMSAQLRLKFVPKQSSLVGRKVPIPLSMLRLIIVLNLNSPFLIHVWKRNFRSPIETNAWSRCTRGQSPEFQQHCHKVLNWRRDRCLFLEKYYIAAPGWLTGIIQVPVQGPSYWMARRSQSKAAEVWTSLVYVSDNWTRVDCDALPCSDRTRCVLLASTHIGQR